MKDAALLNMLLIVETLDVFHEEIGLLKDDAKENILSMLVTLDVFHVDILPLNARAPENIDSRVMTREISHRDKSLLKVEHAEFLLTSNRYDMSVTDDVFQKRISPYVTVAIVELLHHALTALRIVVFVIAVRA